MDQTKRETILDSATKAFTKLGFKKASVDEIARDAGVAKGTVYLAAESKEDLFYQVVHRELRNWIAEVSQLIDPRVPADELLATTSMAAFQYLETHPLVRDLFAGNCDTIMPGWVGRFDELRVMGRATVMELLRLGIRQGRFRADLDVEQTAELLQDLQLVGYLQLARNGPPSAEVLQRRFQAGLALVLDGLRPRPS
ncbi:MAG: TetR/AcrR family transcriptional regulator [Myxococcota bacterium]